jgi:hypothetical protein
VGCAAVIEVVAGNTGYHYVAQSELGNGPREPYWLKRIKCCRLAGGDGAEAAAPRASIPHDDEGRLAVAETLRHVGALGIFADRAELMTPEDLLHRVNFG